MEVMTSLNTLLAPPLLFLSTQYPTIHLSALFDAVLSTRLLFIQVERVQASRRTPSCLLTD